jgi:hypothetical protein
VAERETPAKQCTSTPPFLNPSFIKAIAAGKCLNKLKFEASCALIILYVKSSGKYGFKPDATCSI